MVAHLGMEREHSMIMGAEIGLMHLQGKEF